MVVRRILFADNDVEFLGTRAEILERAGYHVTTASSLAQAEMLLQNHWFHLAILDVRLVDDYDERDLSGIRLAKQTAHSCVPKIMLTKFPEYVQDMLDGLSPRLDFIAKGEEIQVLLEVMERVFTQRLNIGWDLVIQFSSQSSINFFQFSSLLQEGGIGEILLDRSREMEDLFRGIFNHYTKIYIDRLIWHRDGRLAVSVLAFRDGVKPDSFLVVLGLRDRIQADLQRYNLYSPKAYAGNGTVLVNSFETLHYAAGTFALAGGDLENIQTLDEFYRGRPGKLLQAALSNLYQRTLYGWYAGRSIPANRRPLDVIYFDRLKLSWEIFNRSFFEERLRYIENELTLDHFKCRGEAGRFLLWFGEKQVEIPNQLDLFPEIISSQDVDRLIHVPGNLDGDTVLVDEAGHSWLTSFSEAGLAPPYWSYASLEAAIRYDWVNTNRIFSCYQMESCLIRHDFDRLVRNDLDASIRKPVHAIGIIRQLAAQMVGRDTKSYHLGLLFEALHRSANFDLSSQMMEKDKVRFVHLQISILLLLSFLSAGRQNRVKQPAGGYPELQIDPSTYTVILGEKQFQLDPQPFKLLQYLYEHAGKTCSKEELRQYAIGAGYTPNYLYTLIGRIREEIESELHHPVYLVTIPNAGYRLTLKP